MEEHALLLLQAARARFGAPYRQRFAERFKVYSLQWRADYLLQQKTQHELVDAYARHGVHFEQEVSEVLGETHGRFLRFLAFKRAYVETGKELRKALKRYRVHVLALTADTAPFPDDWKAVGQQYWQYFAVLEEYDTLFERWMREDLGDDTVFIRGDPLKDDWHRHPAWQRFEVWLYELLTRQHGLSEGHAFDLISRTIKHFLGTVHFSAKEGPATIRLRVKRLMRQTTAQK